MGKIVNPYMVRSEAVLQRGVFGDQATRREATFLYRVIDIGDPISAELVYSGWWFRQSIEINRVSVWRRISWLTIEREAHFSLPESVDPLRRPGRIEINFSSGLRIRRFRLWIDDRLIYDEVA